jgi:hypothetical protein
MSRNGAKVCGKLPSSSEGAQQSEALGGVELLCVCVLHVCACVCVCARVCVVYMYVDVCVNLWTDS